MKNPEITILSRIWGWFSMVYNMVDKYTKLDNKITDSLRTHEQLLKLLIEMAQEAKMENFGQKVLNLYSESFKSSIERERIIKNPLTEVEIDKLEQYAETVKQGKQLNLDQAREFNDIATKFNNEKQAKGEHDIGAYVLAIVAGFILGLIIGKATSD